jgi:hypothetical protein
MRLTSILLNKRILIEYFSLGNKSYVTYNSTDLVVETNKYISTNVLEYYIGYKLLNRYPNCKIESVELDLNSTPLYNYIQLFSAAKTT